MIETIIIIVIILLLVVFGIAGVNVNVTTGDINIGSRNGARKTRK